MIGYKNPKWKWWMKFRNPGKVEKFVESDHYETIFILKGSYGFFDPYYIDKINPIFKGY